MSTDLSTIKAEWERELGEKIEAVNVLQTGWAGEVISCTLENGEGRIVKTYSSNQNGAETLQKEWDGLNFLFGANYPVPKPLHKRLSSPVPYIVMEEIKGVNFWVAYSNASRQHRVRLLNEFVKALYDLHQLSIQIAPAATVEDSTSSFIQQEIETIKNLSVANDMPYFLSVVAWLEEGKTDIASHNLSILHRDYHPWNVIVREDGRLYVIDTLWDIGDYRFDLAWTCTLLARSNFTGLSTLISQKYEELKHHRHENREYFEVLATQRWLTNVMTGLKTGENLNETRKAAFEAFVLPLIKQGLDLIEKRTKIRIDNPILGNVHVNVRSVAHEK